MSMTRAIAIAAILAAAVATSAKAQTISTPASRSSCWSARRPAAATTSTAAWWRAISAGTFPAIRPSCRRTCRAPAARERPATSPTIAPKDGTVIANIMPGAVMGPLLDPKTREAVRSDRGQVSSATSTTACASAFPAAKSKIKTFDDARKIKAKFGGAGANDSTHDYGFMHTHTTGAIWDVVLGYKGTADLSLALERGEIDGFCGFDWASLKSQKPNWVARQGRERPDPGRDRAERRAHQARRAAHHEIRDERRHDRKVVELILSQQVFHRSFIAPPGTAPAQLAILRKAFDETMADPQFLADAEKLRIDVAPLSGARCRRWCRSSIAAPQGHHRQGARKAINP